MDRRSVLQHISLLAGGTLAGRVARAVAAGTSLHTSPSHSALSASQRHMVSALCELVIPRTDTPGAIDAGVPEFVDQIVTDWYTPAERKIFLDGLGSVEGYCAREYSTSFNRCTAAQQASALSDADLSTRDYKHPPGENVFGTADKQSPFFYKLRQLTVIGYFTSLKGATLELSYNPVPGSYEGDYDFAKTGRQWSS